MTVNESARTGDEAQIHRLVDDWAKALYAKDVDAVMACYAPDVVVFDLAPPLRNAGADLHRSNFTQWFKTFRGPIGSQIRDLRIVAGADVAFSHGLNQITGEKTSGEKIDVWVRVTVCCRKIDGSWKVVHEHVSVPFHMDGSFRAAVDLEP
jgi:uncharacterized protein (TIGR02246 family)